MSNSGFHQREITRMKLEQEKLEKDKEYSNLCQQMLVQVRELQSSLRQDQVQETQRVQALMARVARTSKEHGKILELSEAFVRRKKHEALRCGDRVVQDDLQFEVPCRAQRQLWLPRKKHLQRFLEQDLGGDTLGGLPSLRRHFNEDVLKENEMRKNCKRDEQPSGTEAMGRHSGMSAASIGAMKYVGEAWDSAGEEIHFGATENKVASDYTKHVDFESELNVDSYDLGGFSTLGTLEICSKSFNRNLHSLSTEDELRHQLLDGRSLLPKYSDRRNSAGTALFSGLTDDSVLLPRDPTNKLGKSDVEPHTASRDILSGSVQKMPYDFSSSGELVVNNNSPATALTDCEELPYSHQKERSADVSIFQSDRVASHDEDSAQTNNFVNQTPTQPGLQCSPNTEYSQPSEQAFDRTMIAEQKQRSPKADVDAKKLSHSTPNAVLNGERKQQNLSHVNRDAQAHDRSESSLTATNDNKQGSLPGSTVVPKEVPKKKQNLKGKPVSKVPKKTSNDNDKVSPTNVPHKEGRRPTPVASSAATASAGPLLTKSNEEDRPKQTEETFTLRNDSDDDFGYTAKTDGLFYSKAKADVSADDSPAAGRRKGAISNDAGRLRSESVSSSGTEDSVEAAIRAAASSAVKQESKKTTKTAPAQKTKPTIVSDTASSSTTTTPEQPRTRQTTDAPVATTKVNTRASTATTASASFFETPAATTAKTTATTAVTSPPPTTTETMISSLATETAATAPPSDGAVTGVSLMYSGRLTSASATMGDDRSDSDSAVSAPACDEEEDDSDFYK